MDLIFARGVFLCFFYQNLIRLLFVLFLMSLRVAFQLSYTRRWSRFLFIIVYIGGVLVLAIYTILRSSNWKFPPMRGYLILIFPLCLWTHVFSLFFWASTSFLRASGPISCRFVFCASTFFLRASGPISSHFFFRGSKYFLLVSSSWYMQRRRKSTSL